MPQIYDMGPTALLPFRVEDFFALKIRRLRPGLNPLTWVLKASTLPLDHRIRQLYIYMCVCVCVFLSCSETFKYRVIQMIDGVLTTCHTQYTLDRSICVFFSIL